MTGVNALLNVIRLLIAALLLTSCAVGYYLTVRAGDLAGEIKASENDPIIKIGDRIAAYLFVKSVTNHQRAKFVRAVDGTTISQDRVVRLERIVTLADLLKPGEADPGPDLGELYAEARATAFFRPLCAVVLDTIATRCSVIASGATDRGEGRYELYAEMSYVPASGTMSDAEAGQAAPSAFTDEWYRFNAALAEPVARADYAKRLGDYLADAERVCGDFRASTGHCVISRVAIDEEIGAGGKVSLTGEATFTVAAGGA